MTNFENLTLILTFLLLVAVVILFFLAKRDLNASAADKHAPTVAELEKVRATVEELVDVLEERAGSVERRLSALIEEAHSILGDSSRKQAGVALRMDPPTETGPSVKPSRNRRSTESKFEVVETVPATTTVNLAAEEPIKEIGPVDKEVEPTMLLDPEEDAVKVPEPGVEIPELYRQVYSLSDSGIDSVVEIARRTGLGQSEVEMVLSMRDMTK